MPQHDFDLANQSGAAFRSDLNSAIQALITNSSGSVAPSPTFAHMLWADTGLMLLKQRNAANSGWITLGVLGTANLGLVPLAGNVTMTGALSLAKGANVASATTLSPGIDGNSFTVTGVTDISAINAAAPSPLYLTFEGALTIANSSSLILPGGFDITTVAGDCAVFVYQGSNVWRCAAYQTSPKTLSEGAAVADGKNIETGTVTGTKLGATATQKLALWGAVPVVQPAGASQAAVTLGNANAEIGGLSFSTTYTKAEVEALRDKTEELADDVRSLSTLIHAIRTAAVTTGLIKGGA